MNTDKHRYIEKIKKVFYLCPFVSICGFKLSFLFFAAFFILNDCSLKEAKTDYGLLNEGQKSFANGRFDRAEELFKKLLDGHPDSKLRVYAMMGWQDSFFKPTRFKKQLFNTGSFF